MSIRCIKRSSACLFPLICNRFANCIAFNISVGKLFDSLPIYRYDPYGVELVRGSMVTDKEIQ